MNYWHMQLHPDDKSEWNSSDIRTIVSRRLIGCSGSPVTMFQTIRIGDYVLVRHGGEVIALTRVVSNPEVTPLELKDEYIWFDNYCTVDILETYENEHIYGKGWFIPKTLMPIDNDIAYDYVINLLDKIKLKMREKTFKDNLYLLKYKKQIILQGPPGTGKTREAKLLAEAIASKNVAENISHKHIGDIIYEGLILKTKENYSFQVKEVDIQIKRIIIIPQSAPVNEYPVTFDQILKCYESKGWNDKISQWNQNGNASYLVSISKHIYDFLLEKNKDTIKTVQFHPSYTYEDFVRGIIAKPNDDGEGITYEAENKILGKFVEDAMKNLDGLQKSSLNIYDEEVFEQFRLSIILKITEDEKYELTNNIYISEVDEKKFKYKGDNWKRHPKGLNIRFSELKKVIESNPESRQNIVKNTSLKSLTKSHATYFFELYTKYKEFYDTNKNDLISIEGEKKYVLIIDEINRANLSAVLGELIYALEYRGEEVESMYEVDGSQKLVLPPNLYIIGTMNTADRSVGHIDYAIRRRFAFVDVLPEKLEDTEDVLFNTPNFIEVAKLFIKVGEDEVINFENADDSDFLANDFSSKDVALGHSYFIADRKKISEEEKDNYFKMKMKYEVIPILNEYLRDGVFNESATAKIKDIEQRFA